MYGLTSVVLGFDGTGLIHIPDDPIHSSLESMSPGFGYWIKSISGTVLAYPGWGRVPFTVPDRQATLPLPKTTVTPTSNWISVYGKGLTIDDRQVADGALFEFVGKNGTVCGEGRYTGGLLKFTPVYARDGQTEATVGYPAPGEQVTIRVDGVPVQPLLTMTGEGDRVQLPALKTGGLVPETYALEQNYPNPFNPTTQIGFSLPEAGHVTVEIFNIMGQRVTTLVDEWREAGSHVAVWNGLADDGSRVSSGVYLYRLSSGSFVETKKMMLLK
jgi:hypothetical protein